MRKFLTKIISLVNSGLHHRTEPTSLTFLPQSPEEPTVYRLPYKPVNEKIIGSLRSRGWRITLEVNADGDMEYSINLEKTAATADKK
jgi:hypothetical protein